MFKWRRGSESKSQTWHRFSSINPETGQLEEFSVVDLVREKFSDALDHMLKHFLPDEPICKSKNVTQNQDALNEICDLWKNVMEQNVTLACYKKDCDEIIGLNILCVLTKDDYRDIKFDVNSNNTWKAVHDFALVNFNLFEKYKFTENILIAYGLSVNNKFRRRGIATEILRSRIPLCHELKIPLTSTVFTASGSQRPAEKIGFVVDYEVAYDNLAEVNEELKFQNLETNSLKLMSLVIN
jgi:RimJ/RimL family protein N-acetyltransferase